MSGGTRETAWRVFSAELNTASFEIKAEAEKMPSYQVSRLGAMINRVLVAGVLTEKENVGTPDEPMWRGRIQDVASGTVYINIGRYQPEAAAAMVDIDTPCLVAVVGKVKSYTTEDMRTYVSVRPERIIPIDENIQKEWLLDTAKSTWKRLTDIKKATGVLDKTEDGLRNEGFSELSAKGISKALEVYGTPDSTPFLKSVQAALRELLPDKNIDLGLPEDLSENPEEIDLESGSEPDDESEDKEQIVLGLLKELDTEGKGAPRDDLERRAEQEGISSMELEEITNTLMDKGVVYEPNLRYLKLI